MSLRASVLEATAHRDRVRDAVKALALGLVVVGHGLAWTTTGSGGLVNTLDVAPQMAPLTWVLQILPLFFLIAGAGLIRPMSASTITARITRLVGPAVPLLIIVGVGTVALQAAARPEWSQAFGLVPVQLVWFLGVYLLLIAAAPIIRRMRTWWHAAAWLLAIAVVDVLRIHVAAGIGWLNLFLVWGLFAVLGTRLDQLRALPRRWCVAVAVAAIVGAITLVRLGPYSSALISTEAVPGITNLAPPTLVLALVGVAQVGVLLGVWPLLDRLLRRDAWWVAVAVFASRAMQVYLFHMLVLTLVIAGVLVLGWAPPPLGALWWVLHLGVLATVVVIVWTAAPALRRLADALVRAGSRLVPARCGRALGRSRLAATALAVLTSVSLLTMSEAGLAEPFQVRLVIGVPYVAVVPWTLVLLALAWSAAAAPLPPGLTKR